MTQHKNTTIPTGVPISESREELQTKQSLPLVTIGLPVFNGEDFLEEAIESLIGQSLGDFELIISDNASTDSTKDIVERFLKRDPRVRYIRQPKNIGAARNFVFVLEQARTELFMWASHDDIWAENWLEVLTKNITHQDIGIRGRLLLMQEDTVIADKVLPSFRQGDSLRCFLGNENNYRSHYVYSLFNREKLLTTKLETINVDYYPDAIFVYCLVQQGSLRTITETYLRYRLHDRNLGHDYSNPWKGWEKILYRIHPLRYYIYYIRYSKNTITKCTIFLFIPVKHIYSQISFWIRGFRQIITNRAAA